MLYNLLTSIVTFSVFLSGPFFVQMKEIQPRAFVLGSEYTGSFTPHRIPNKSLGIEISATSALVVDEESNYILFSKKSNGVLPAASITKLMTALTFLDFSKDWKEMVQLTAQDAREGNRVYLFTGEQVSIQTLFELMLIASSNEAAVALVHASGVDMDTFVDLMNKKAANLKLENTKFFDPTGLDIRNMSSARDITILAKEAFSRPDIERIVGIDTYNYSIANTGTERVAYNTNQLLKSFLNNSQYGFHMDGGKTGFLNEVGHNITVRLQKDNHPVIITILGSVGETGRQQDLKGLASWVYDNYTWEEGA